jgi:tetratricopeptide (TPR) repeat protein
MLLNVQESQSQTIDTLVNVANHKLHFKIIKGKGIPILFESGAGDDGKVWDSILKPIVEITGATLITYDRAGFGKSTLDTVETDALKHGVLSGLEDLENALKILGYAKQIMLVSHSYGGYFTTLYASKHPDLVKSIVLIDVNHNFEERYAEKDVKEHEQETNELKKSNPGFYYLAVNLLETAKLMSTISIPQNIPVIDLVNEISLFDDKEKQEYWKECHKKFLSTHPKSIEITAYGCGHYIMVENPCLVITTIARSYAEIVSDTQKIGIYKRSLNYAILASSETVRENHSENNLNSWGYDLIGQGDSVKALEIFRLNVALNPTSWNAYDSYGETLLKFNQKEEAIKMYKKSVELNPENENGKKVLEELLKQ